MRDAATLQRRHRSTADLPHAASRAPTDARTAPPPMRAPSALHDAGPPPWPHQHPVPGNPAALTTPHPHRTRPPRSSNCSSAPPRGSRWSAPPTPSRPRGLRSRAPWGPPRSRASASCSSATASLRPRACPRPRSGTGASRRCAAAGRLGWHRVRGSSREGGVWGGVVPGGGGGGGAGGGYVSWAVRAGGAGAWPGPAPLWVLRLRARRAVNRRPPPPPAPTPAGAWDVRAGRVARRQHARQQPDADGRV